MNLLQTHIVIIVVWNWYCQFNLQKKIYIAIRQYPDDTRILPTNNNVDVYQYSASQLKYLPKNAISTIEKTSLCSKKPVYLDVDVDRRSNDNNDQK